MSRRRSTALPAETERKLWEPLEPQPPLPTLWERQAHRLLSASHDAAICPLCRQNVAHRQPRSS
jgi:hypothetical protein